MALKKSRKRIFVRGLGDLKVREVDPTPGTTFDNVGFIKTTTLDDVSTIEVIMDETGQVADVKEVSRRAAVETSLQQTSIDEFNLLKNASLKVHAVQYYGLTSQSRFQYFGFEHVRLVPSIALGFQPGERLLPLRMIARKQGELSFDVPVYYMAESEKAVHLDDLQFWVDPNLAYNVGTTKILDISGWARHGTLNLAALWTTGTPGNFLRFDGAVDNASFGDVLNLDADNDFLIDFWLRMGAGTDGVAQEVMSKKAGDVNEAGWRITRNASDQIEFKISDGSTSATIASTGTIQVADGWKHFAIAGDRNGNATVYVNSVAGTPGAISSVTDATTATVLYLGRLASGYGEVDLGAVRFWDFGAGNLPGDVATIIANHYNGEKSLIYGL